MNRSRSAANDFEGGDYGQKKADPGSHWKPIFWDCRKAPPPLIERTLSNLSPQYTSSTALSVHPVAGGQNKKPGLEVRQQKSQLWNMSWYGSWRELFRVQENKKVSGVAVTNKRRRWKPEPDFILSTDDKSAQRTWLKKQLYGNEIRHLKPCDSPTIHLMSYTSLGRSFPFRTRRDSKR